MNVRFGVVGRRGRLKMILRRRVEDEIKMIGLANKGAINKAKRHNVVYETARNVKWIWSALLIETKPHFSDWISLYRSLYVSAIAQC